MDTQKRGEAFAHTLGAQVAADAKFAGVTIKDLAARMGIDRSQFDRYLKGARPMPSSVLVRAAEALDVSPQAVVERAYLRFLAEHGAPGAVDAQPVSLAAHRAGRAIPDRKATSRAARKGSQDLPDSSTDPS